MNNDRISNTPGGEKMLVGGIVLGLSLVFYNAVKYNASISTKLFFMATMAYGAVQLGRGIWAWKYADRESFNAERSRQNLLVDIPIRDGNYEILHEVEDALIDLIRISKSVDIDLHSIDKANNMGTINLHGRDADAMFAYVYATLAKFATPNGLHLFPKPGHPIDTEIHGKRLLIDLPSLEISLNRTL
jgi:hypothetical protein